MNTAVRQSVSTAEMKIAKEWVAAHLAGDPPPFSFTYGGRPCADLLPAWKREETVNDLDSHRAQRVTAFTDPRTGLMVRCVAVVYRDFPVVETMAYRLVGKWMRF